MSLAVDIIKQEGNRKSELFSHDKLFASIVAACLSVRTPEGQAETIAQSVCDNVSKWLETRSEVTSNDIRLVAVRSLNKYHPEAAYLYEQHKVTI